MDEKLDLMGDFKASHRHHAWDGKNTIEIRNYTHCIHDERRRKMVESILDAFQHEIIDANVQFRTGILQADFNDANILVDSDCKVSGVIDFGDSVCSWRVLDISVAMAYAMLSAYGKNGRAISAASTMLRGFNSIYPLQDVERKHLHLLVTCRLACSATLGAFSYQQNPENTYLLLHSEPAWRTLELIWGYDADHRVSIKASVDRMFDVACSNVDTSDYCCTDLALPDPYIVDCLSVVREMNDNTKPSLKRQRTNGKPTITFVTGNKKKLEEVKRILGGNGNGNLPFDVTNAKVDLPELQGDPVDISKEKCSTAAREVGGAVITEDTSLCFRALKGLPGPYIKWFLDSLGLEGLNNLIASSDDKSAYAQTIVAFCPAPGEDVVVFDGRTMGKIVKARGSLEFGWDPVFEPDEGNGLTYAEMSKDQKDAISHRSRAFSQLRDYFVKEQKAIVDKM
jgi:inosine triphosphate pyrophosphatase